jgi:hypothetical protein
MTKAWLLIGIAFLGGACATQAQREADAERTSFTTAIQVRDECLYRATRSDAYEVVKGKLPDPGATGAVPLTITETILL